MLTALGERDGAVRDAERRAGQALQTMTEDEGFSGREVVEWCGSGCLTCGRSAGYANLCTTRWAAAADKRAMHRPAWLFAQPSERQPCPRRVPWRSRPAQRWRLIVHVWCGHGHRAGRGRDSRTGDAQSPSWGATGTSHADLSRRSLHSPWVRPRQRPLAYLGVPQPARSLYDTVAQSPAGRGARAAQRPDVPRDRREMNELRPASTDSPAPATRVGRRGG